MKVIFLDEPYIFSYIPLTYPAIDETIILSLRNESKSNFVDIECTQTQSKGRVYVTIPTESIDFKDGEKYSIKINDYFGKLMVVKAGQSIQNYTYGSKLFK